MPLQERGRRQHRGPLTYFVGSGLAHKWVELKLDGDDTWYAARGMEANLIENHVYFRYKETKQSKKYLGAEIETMAKEGRFRRCRKVDGKTVPTVFDEKGKHRWIEMVEDSDKSWAAACVVDVTKRKVSGSKVGYDMTVKFNDSRGIKTYTAGQLKELEEANCYRLCGQEKSCFGGDGNEKEQPETKKAKIMQ